MVGALTERLTIQQDTPSTDALGGQSVVPGTLATVWGAVTALAGRELMQAQAVNARVTYRVVVRYRADVTPAMRLLWTPSWSSGTAQKTLEIHSVRPAGRFWLELDCGERA